MTHRPRQLSARWILGSAGVLAWLVAAVGAVSGGAPLVDPTAPVASTAAPIDGSGMPVVETEAPTEQTEERDEKIEASLEEVEASPEEVDSPASGLRVFRDPETGQFVTDPNEAQRRLLALHPRAAVSRSVQGLRPFTLEGGGRGINLQGRFQSALMVRVMEDGSLRTTCGDPAHAGLHDDHTSPATADDREAAGAAQNAPAARSRGRDVANRR
ncbi:MAG TPA: hypothetical protein VMS86_15030 [Thermoanaerobaculia bacterium]|nr:hypothetical protein [Thermoanaerobaculia bacterium]